ncbi:MAG: hypothetical protein IJL05_02960 [Alphaproteobacteria bacterium]|nr:hypothetical protein [Alphaproteobacteria bacterium]
MAEMIVYKKHFYENTVDTQRGASILEVILSITIIFAVAPFLYNQIIDMSHDIEDITMANKVVKTRDNVINFLRVNQTQWPDTVEIKMTDEDLIELSSLAHAGFIDKYQINGATITDVYLAFDVKDSVYRSANVAKYIGEDAAIVREDGIAYSHVWAVSAPDVFQPGDLIYRISHDFAGADKSRFLHRGTMGEDELNHMKRDLYMNNFNIFNVANIKSLSAKILDVETVFLDSDMVDTDTVYFTSGANINSSDVSFGSMRVTGDTNGFRNITANKLNADKYVTNSKIIVDSATVDNSVNVAGNMILKSSSARTITGFNGIATNKLLTPYISATEMIFTDNFGITVSGELLVSNNAPLRIGSWSFPTNVPPSFSRFILTRASVPSVPDATEFKNITSENWHTK